MHRIRPAEMSDIEACYRVSLLTGHGGKDASHLYTDQKMMGHIYSAPYLKFSPELCLVVTSHDQVVGFCVGTRDTVKFRQLLEREWWPDLRAQYSKPSAENRENWSAEERRRQMIHEPETVPKEITSRFPGHIHLNLLPEAQGRGIGRELLTRWVQTAKSLALPAAHVGVNVRNEGAATFWTKMGFKTLDAPASRTIWMGCSLEQMQLKF